MLKGVPNMDDIAMRLEDVCQGRGLVRVNLPPFEEYSLYSTHTGFFRGEPLVTFTAPSGRLMALKPDATLSAVRAWGGQRGVSKLYYTDQVFRLDRHSGDFAQTRQFGVELMGDPDPFSDVELVDLALECLEQLGDYALDMAQMGLLERMMDAAGLTDVQREALQGAIRAKSEHRVSALLTGWGVKEGLTAQFSGLCRQMGPLPQALPLLSGLDTPGTQPILADLTRLVQALGDRAQRIKLDFSVEGDMDYYSGLALKGYVAGAPAAVLTGGRYDRLMPKLGKRGAAAGFAINLSLLDDEPAAAQRPQVVGRYATEAWAEALDWQRTMRQTGCRARLAGPEEPTPAGVPVVDIVKRGGGATC